MLLRTLAIASTLALAAPAAYAAPEAPVAVETVKVKAPQQNQADANGYAEREKQDTKAADFQGGDMVVIGISGGAILVLLLLLLILA
jgi:lipoprotein-anchoring transpeptidase ErfK/SrfK